MESFVRTICINEKGEIVFVDQSGKEEPVPDYISFALTAIWFGSQSQIDIA